MKIGVAGTGAWATALTQVLVDNEKDVIMYGVSKEEIDDINENHRNSRYYDCEINHGIKASMDIGVLKDCDIILIAVPVMAYESVLTQLKELLDEPKFFINVSKGFHPVTNERLSVFIKRFLGEKAKEVISVIGPSFADEVILRKVTTVNSVCENEEASAMVQELFSNDYFRVYRNTDVIGAEIAAALKNVMAIASGTIEGLGGGNNTRAALMTRGLAEMTRFGVFFGGKKETFLGLNGVGDLVLTCGSSMSRNYQAGMAIGKADGSEEFLKNNKKTTEGINTARVVHALAIENNISMPITEQVYKVLFEGEKPSLGINNLMRRELKKED